MKSYYLLIVCGATLTPDTKFYKVAIGSSQRDVRCCRFLTQWAQKEGHFFEKWCVATDLFLEKIAQSLSLKVLQLQFTSIEIRSLIGYIKAHGVTPKIPPLSKSAAYCRQIIDPAMHFSMQINVIRRAEAQQRKKPKAKSVSTKGLSSPYIGNPLTDGIQ